MDDVSDEDIWQPLPTLTSTRIVKVLEEPGDGPFKLIIQRMVIDLDDVAEGQSHYLSYIALSYTWGSPVALPDWKQQYSSHQNVTIGVYVRDGRVRPIQIGRNLYEGLIELRRLETGHWHWIDALSINQADLKEKSVQVALMAAIYAKSALVVIWPGAGDLSLVASFFVNLNQTLFEYEQENGPLPPEKFGYLEGIGMNVADTTFNDKMIRAVWDFFAQRRYFSRVWVMQEVALATDASILLDQQLIPLVVLARVQKFLAGQDFPTTFVRKISKELSGSGEEIFQTWRGYHLGEQLRTRTSAAREYLSICFDVRETDGPPWYAGTWLMYLGTMQQRFATDPRDHVYGLASLVSANAACNTAHNKIGLDYTKSAEDVFEGFTTHLLHALNNLSVLSLVCNGAEGMALPSFVPDYRFAGRHKPLLTSCHAVWGTLPSVLPETYTQPIFEVIDHKLHIFRGHKVGIIEIAKEMPKTAVKSEDSMFESQRTVPDHQHSTLGYLSLFTFAIDLSQELRSLQKSGKSTLEAVFRVLCYSSSQADGLTTAMFAERVRNDIMMHLTDMALVSVSEEVSQTSNEVKTLFAQHASESFFPDLEELECRLVAAKGAKALREALQMAQANDDMDAFLSRWEDTPEMHSFYEFRDFLNRLTPNRSPIRRSEHEVDFIFASQEYVGRVTCQVSEGDEIWLFDGARVPFIVRRQGDQYRLLCEAFIPGLMYWDDLSAVKASPRKIVLV